MHTNVSLHYASLLRETLALTLMHFVLMNLTAIAIDKTKAILNIMTIIAPTAVDRSYILMGNGV